MARSALEMRRRKAFAQWLRKQRRKEGLTQEDLAHLLGKRVVTVNRWENEHTYPSLSDQEDIERRLGWVSPELSMLRASRISNKNKRAEGVLVA